jgi:hypothetical protein
MMTEEITIGDTTYTLKTRLGWLEQQRIDQSAIKLYADGQTVSDAEDVRDLPEVEIRINSADQNYLRLCLRLVGLKPIEIKNLPPYHVPILIERVTQLEAEEKAQVAELSEQHPLLQTKSRTMSSPAIVKSLKE